MVVVFCGHRILNDRNEIKRKLMGLLVEIFKEAGIDMKVNPVTTEEYSKLVPNQAKRPLNSRLSKQSLVNAGFNKLPDWKDALSRYLKELSMEDK